MPDGNINLHKGTKSTKMETMSVKGQDFFLLSLSKRLDGMATWGGGQELSRCERQASV